MLSLESVELSHVKGLWFKIFVGTNHIAELLEVGDVYFSISESYSLYFFMCVG